MTKRNGNVLNMSIKYIFLEKNGSGIFLVFNPRSKRILKQWSPFSNGDSIFLYQDTHIVLSNLLAQGWEPKEQGEYY